MTPGATLARAAARWPEKTALVFEGRRWSFRHWNREANRAANAFAARGIGQGDRVAVLAWNLPEQVTAFYGLLKLGAVPVPINTRLAANEVRYIVEDCGARLLVFEAALRESVAGLADDREPIEGFVLIGEGGQAGETAWDDFVAPASAREPAGGPGADDTAFIMYTSGTTGRPKGVVRSHRAELAGGRTMAELCGFGHEDRIIDNKPLFHIAQLQLQFLPFVALGATNVMTRGFDIDETLALVEAERLTCLHGVPTQLVAMMQADLSRHDLASLAIGFFGGQTLADEVTRKCMALFRDRFLNIYGSTEALALTACDYRRHPDRLGGVGRAAPGMEVRILGASAEAGAIEDLAAPGEVGELIARGPSLMSEYFGLPGLSEAALAGGWYHSGDAAVADADGFVTVLGRMDHTIKTGGENVHPSEVENLLFTHPAIADAAVVGLPSARWGQAVCAAIVAKDPALSAEALDRFCRTSPDLARFKRPRRYFFLDEIPANATGKVERGRLADQLAARLAGPLP